MKVTSLCQLGIGLVDLHPVDHPHRVAQTGFGDEVLKFRKMKKRLFDASVNFFEKAGIF